MNHLPPLKVAVESRLVPERFGGVAHAAKSLIEALGQLEDGDEQYVILVGADDEREYMSPHLGSNQRLCDLREFEVETRPTQSVAEPRWRLAARSARYEVARRARNLLAAPVDDTLLPRVDLSNGSYERTGCDVLHIPRQHFTLCAMPTVYNPHDLQHLHYPQFFTPSEIAKRETVYRTACQISRCVVVGSEWIRDDVIGAYSVDPRRVQVIPEGSPTQFAQRPTVAELGFARAKHLLPEQYLLYPAVAWPHKNHLRLFEAMTRLRERDGLRVNLVCTGGRYEPFRAQIDAAVENFQLQGQVRLLGYLDDHDLSAVYQMASALVLPSLFEASSLPIFEAWQAGVPVASSNATALPEQADGAALLFSPVDVDEIADAIRRVLLDEALRADLITQGARRLGDFDWKRAARGYRAVYRRTAGYPLTDEDRWLLSWTSMRDAGTTPGERIGRSSITSRT